MFSGQLVFEKRIFEKYLQIFNNFVSSPFERWQGPSSKKTLDLPYLRMLCANWPSGFGGEVENVKNLQTDGCRTKSDQNS